MRFRVDLLFLILRSLSLFFHPMQTQLILIEFPKTWLSNSHLQLWHVVIRYIGGILALPLAFKLEMKFLCNACVLVTEMERGR